MFLCILYLKRVPSPPHLLPSIPAEMKYFKIVSKLFLSLLKFTMKFCLWVGADSTRPSGCFCHCTVTVEIAAFISLQRGMLLTWKKQLALIEIEQKLSGVIGYTSHNIFVKTEFHFNQESLRYPSEDHDIIWVITSMLSVLWWQHWLPTSDISINTTKASCLFVCWTRYVTKGEGLSLSFSFLKYFLWHPFLKWYIIVKFCSDPEHSSLTEAFYTPKFESTKQSTQDKCWVESYTEAHVNTFIQAPPDTYIRRCFCAGSNGGRVECNLVRVCPSLPYSNPESAGDPQATSEGGWFSTLTQDPLVGLKKYLVSKRFFHTGNWGQCTVNRTQIISRKWKCVEYNSTQCQLWFLPEGLCHESRGQVGYASTVPEVDPGTDPRAEQSLVVKPRVDPGEDPEMVQKESRFRPRVSK